MAKRLRSGFTTGACAAVAAKGAAIGYLHQSHPETVTIAFPDGSRKSFFLHRISFTHDSSTASIIKDAGDDPDVTNGAEIIATITKPSLVTDLNNCVTIDNITLCGGRGVGRVTKPGLAVGVNEPAINPIPRQMIINAVQEVIPDNDIAVIISVKDGELLAERTLNKRLGILNGLSILGTTGIVRPVSAEAWTATIKASLDVAKEAGITDIVFSTGRTSEKGAQALLTLPEEAYVMMGDYLEFSLLEATKRDFSKIHVSGMWAKIMKAALRIPQTHVRHGALQIENCATLLGKLRIEGKLLEKCKNANTAREIYEHLVQAKQNRVIEAVCLEAKKYCQEVAKNTAHIYLVDHKGVVITHV